MNTVAIRLPLSSCSLDDFLTKFIELTVGNSIHVPYEAEVEPEEDNTKEEEIEVEDNVKYLKTLDPTEWKNQDHYKVLGLSSKRINATEAQVRYAYRQMVLKHHPDKRHIPIEQRDSDYYPCITKAYDVLGNPKSRKSYDSVDPTFDDSVPKARHITPQNFIELFSPVFERNSRWSIKKPVPTLGDDETSYDDLMNFYKFWLNFDSWREYSYLDEEEKERGGDREERRYIDKLNKAERQKRKNAENLRMRQLVDLAMSNDYRIKRKREEENQKKQQERDRKRQAQLEKEAEERAKAEAIHKKLQEKQRLEALKLEEEKKEREALKKNLKAQRKSLKDLCKKFNNFSNDEDIELKSWWLENIDVLCQNLSIEELKDLNEQLASLNGARKNIENCLRRRIEAELARIKEKSQKELEEQQAKQAAKPTPTSNGTETSSSWTPEEIQCLTRALQVLPPGTDKRWVAISNFINNHVHGGSQVKTAKQVVAKAKTLQGVSNQEAQEAKNQMKKEAVQSFLHNATNGGPSTQEITSAPTERSETVVDEVKWTNAEQKLLEAALKNYPPDTDKRWEKIAEAVPGKSKKDCMKRYKEIVELLKAKKAAQTKK